MQTVHAHPGLAECTAPILSDVLWVSGLRVGADMTVEGALSVMAGAQVDRLFVCDEDDRRTGLVTRIQLTAVRDSPSYTDLVRLQDVMDVDKLPTGTATRPLGTALQGLMPCIAPPSS